MIRKLRIKFIALTMLSLFLVLGLILGAINVINYHNIVEDADRTLQVLQENGGSFPMGQKPPGQMKQEDNAQAVPPADSQGGSPGDRDEMIRKDREGMHRETPYSARYFWVLFDGKAGVLQTNIDRIISVDESTAEDYAGDVMNKSAEKGFYGDYRYVIVKEDDCTRVIFLDCWSDLTTFRDFRTASILIALAGMLAVFLLIFFLSSRIIRPISESYEKQKRFITDAGHEIKTPLAIIDADAEVLEMDVGEDNEWVADIRQQIKRLTGLTNDLIYLSRMEEGGQNLLKTEFSFSEAMEETAQPFRSLAKVQEKELSIGIEQDVTIHADEKSIRQLASILMDNAMKYSPEGSVVSLNAGKNARGVYLTVENEAKGLKRTDVEHLFDRFYRADASRNSEKGGHGIGLSMARAITEAHGGKIHGELLPGERLRITAQLPSKK